MGCIIGIALASILARDILILYQNTNHSQKNNREQWMK